MLSSPLPKSPATKRTASPPPAVQPLDLHSWADSWSTGFSKVPSKLGHEASWSGVSPVDGSHSAAGEEGVWRWQTKWAGQGEDHDKFKALAGAKEESWIETADVDDGFLLDEQAPSRLRINRANSLDLDFGAVSPPPSFLATAPAYLSPYNPAAFSCSGSYFPRQSLSANAQEPALPPSPALVPLPLSPAPAFTPTSPAPRVQPAPSHPLHHTRRLSMTPVSTDPPVLHPSPRLAPPPQVRKKSIVDLPTPIIGGEAPLTPPTTPVEGEFTPKWSEKKERGHKSQLAAARSARATKLPATALTPQPHHHP
ncbi:hypothetical protein JCM10213_008250 [Rhodosporidiobolus nylandii]